uniref:Uncharacterized protein n=1 Tax=Globisporangium ultimum (strain ATCC 200006 / CBS 805.95 / DAOM BR144) TaxID=431595 RepID=K3WC77_GLOUD
MAPREALWGNYGNKISTLVLVKDTEYDFEPQAQTIRISLKPREQEDEECAASACIPLVITVPFTQRFKLEGSAELASPFMPLLYANSSLEYTIEFARPQLDESDFVWDNFQDQIVIQTRLGKLVVRLQAIKSDASGQVVEPDSYFPRSLPEIRAPSLKLFEFIESNYRQCAREETSSSVRHEKMSESFNASKKKPENMLAPIVQRPRSPASPPVLLPSIPSRPHSSERQQTPRSTRTESNLSNCSRAVPSPPQAPGYSTEVSNQVEAKAIILKLRARNSTRCGANSHGTASSTIPGNDSLVAEEPFPESRLDAKTKAQLGEFNHLVLSVKEGVVNDQAVARSELDYYRQFLPKSSSDTTPLGSARGASSDGTLATRVSNVASLQPVESRASDPVATSLASSASGSPSTLAMGMKKSKVVLANKPPAKLPTLSVAAIHQTRASKDLPGSSASAIRENNQETSPVRVSKSAADAAKNSDMASAAANTQASRPQQLRKSAATLAAPPAKTTASSQAPFSSSSGKVSNAFASPTIIIASKRVPSGQRLTKEPSQASVKDKPRRDTTTKQTSNSRLSSKPEDPHNVALSDFDDPDPEIDDAPILPDDLCTMRCGDFRDPNDDEY